MLKDDLRSDGSISFYVRSALLTPWGPVGRRGNKCLAGDERGTKSPSYHDCNSMQAFPWKTGIYFTECSLSVSEELLSW